MITTGFDAKVKIQQIIENQLPEYLLSESPKAVEFFKQYYISQEFQGGTIDIIDNLDQYTKLDNLTPEVITDTATLSVGISTISGGTANDPLIVNVSSTKGFPEQYGLFKIDDEIFTYTDKTATTFTGVIRGFSGVTEYDTDNDKGELVFSSSSAATHASDSKIINLSSLFLKEFYKKIKYSLTPGLEDSPFVKELDVSNFIKESRSFYEAKGTEESFRILFEVLYGVKPKVVDLEQFLVKPSSAEFIRREIVIAESISGDPNKLVGQTITKSTDSGTRASVSEIEPFTRTIDGNNKTYYKLSLFVGYNDRDLIEGTFTVPGKTKVIGDVSIGSSVISVDSTIGFNNSGIVISNGNYVTYTDKTVNQFLNCTGIGTYISTSEDLRSDEVIFGYEDGNSDKRVELRITGVLNKFVSIVDAKLANEGEEIYVKNVGEKILNPESNKTKKEIFSNTWIYNTASRYQIEPTISGSTFVLYSDIDKSGLKVGDFVSLLERNTQIIVEHNSQKLSTLEIETIVPSTRTITVGGLGSWQPPTKADGGQFEFDIRRVLNTASSSKTPIKYGNKLTSDVQNVYNDADKNLYVSSNSLPSYDLKVGAANTTTLGFAGVGTITDRVGNTDNYNTIAFPNDVPFVTGDVVYYTPEDKPIVGLSTGQYYVKVLPNFDNKIRLYKSRPFIFADSDTKPTNIGLGTLAPDTGSHTFTLLQQYDKQINSHKIFKKFPLSTNIKSGKEIKTKAGSVGLLKNGVEIYSYKSDDTITYGPIQEVTVLNSGSNYDVINPPKLTLSAPPLGFTTALVQPVVSGNIKDVYIDVQDFDIVKVNSITISGGNGSSALLEPILARRYRNLVFDARLTTNSGGVDRVNDNIAFETDHNLLSGEPVVYNNNGNDNLGISTNLAINVDTGQTLQSGSRYWPKVINPKTIELYATESDYSAGINTVGFTTAGTSGVHKFILFGDKNTLQSIKVIDSGSGYTNRKLTINSSGISTVKDTITFTNHGFSNNEVITYNYETTSISGLSKLNQYRIIKIDDDSFRLANSGLNAEIIDNGTFTSDFTGWSKYGPDAVEIINGQLRITRTTGYTGIEQLMWVVKDTTYRIKYDMFDDAGTGVPIFRISSGGNGAGTFYVDTGSTGSQSYTWKSPVNGYVYVNLILGNGNGVGRFDNLSIKEENAGTDYDRNKFVKLYDTGSGYQYFEYPSIEITADVEYSATSVTRSGIITATPIVRGGITQIYTYENGTGYGSTILNFERTPILSVNAGKGCQLKPIITAGQIVNVEIQNRGNNYTAAPDLEVVGISSGIGAKLRAELTNGQVTGVKILSKGIDYNPDKTSIKVTSPGNGLIEESKVRKLSINNYERFGGEYLIDRGSSLQYSFIGYSTSKGFAGGIFNDPDPNTGHSPIIGWAYDGNPIYGPYGYSDPLNKDSTTKVLQTGYDITTVTNRPIGFSNGYFVQDYKFNNSGDLDVNNGRYCKTPEFPQGTYAYFVGVSTDGQLKPEFPYFIGDSYRSDPVEDNFALTNNQNTFNFNSSGLMRNTLPYQVSEEYSDNDFIIESNEAVEQISVIESVTRGSVDSLQIVEAGSNYKVGDSASFDNTGTKGSGLSAEVSKVKGVPITNVTTNITTYDDVPLVWNNENEISAYIATSHNLISKDIITLSGVSTTLAGINEQNYRIGVTTSVAILYKDLPANSTVGVVTDIYLSTIPNSISVGSSIGIGTERLSVLNVFDERSILRVKRNSKLGEASTVSTRVEEIPSYLTIPAKSKYFDSKVNDIVYFNPKQSIGLGTTAGISTSVNYSYGEINEVISIQHQSLYLPNHPFKNSQAVTFTTPTGTIPLSVKDTPTGQQFNVPAAGSTQTLYVINKSKDYIGLTTQIGSTTSTDGLYFATNGLSNFEYSLTTNYTQKRGRIDKIVAKVTVSAEHKLSNQDVVKLTVVPNQSVGIGTSTGIYVKYIPDEDIIVTNPVGFGSIAVNTNGGNITIPDHPFKTGDKVFYDGITGSPSGISTGKYYIYKNDSRNIRIAETYKDAISGNIVSLGSTGGITQEISKLHPPIKVLRNNNLVFDLSDASLSGREFKLFYDSEFKNEFVSTGSTDNFVLTGVGTPGTTGATLTLRYTANNPQTLYYNLEKSGYISTSDVTSKHNSSIVYGNSSYNDYYSIFDVTSTTFDIPLTGLPERLDYTQSNTETLKYSTNASTARGGVDTMNIAFGGYGYKRLPSFVSIASTQGSNAELLPTSKKANKINEVRIKDPGFEYSSDQTLRPEAFVSPVISVVNSDAIEKIDIVSGGKNYTAAPDLVVVDPNTGTKSTEGIIESTLNGTSINKVNIIESPKGLTAVEQSIKAINNTNGFAIRTVTGPATTGSSGLITVELVTPVLGFNTTPPPFVVGDKIFVEGIVSNTAAETALNVTDITGFNSEDYKYNLFPITAFNNLAAGAQVTYDVSGILTSTRPGIAVTAQNSYAFVVRADDYPTFKVTQNSGDFLMGEGLLRRNTFGTYTPIDLIIKDSNNNQIKIKGSTILKSGDVIRGRVSGNTATINTIEDNIGRFDIDYSLRQDKGWINDIGKLNQDFQCLPDNDYYQNLSYTVQSPITYENIADPVNRLLHTSGLKNFADVGIGTTVASEAGLTSTTNATTVVRDIFGEERVDTIYNFDQAKDIDVDATGTKSKFVKLKSTKLTDYIECISNRVLAIDDFSDTFSNSESRLSGYVDTLIDSSTANYLVQIRNPSTNDIQVTELELYQDSDDIFTVETSNLYSTTNPLGELLGTTNNQGSPIIRFKPTDTFDSDYDLKFVKNTFNSSLTGIGTLSFGFVNLVGVNTTVGVGTTVSLVSDSIVDIESYFVEVEVVNQTQDEKNIVEIYVTHDGTNTYLAEYYSGSSNIPSVSSNFIGTFAANITSNVLSLNFNNDTSDEVFVRSRVVGFGTTAAGIGTYRMREAGQIAGSERTLMMESNHSIISNASASTAYQLPTVGISSTLITTVKSLVKVSTGSTIAMHQLLLTHDRTSTYLTQYPIISVGSTTGMGKFAASYVGTGNTQINVSFQPDPEVAGNNIDVQRLDELIYTTSDLLNDAPPLDYGTGRKQLNLAAYDGINGDRANKFNFNAEYNGTPIFAKEFNPGISTFLNASTGIFTIKDHFFRNGEKLNYTPKSTWTGIAAAGIQTASGVIPSEVYVIRLDKDRFKLSVSGVGATASTPSAMTYTNTGSGNAHTLEMDKKLSKSLLSIDDVIQSPVAYSHVNTALNGNGGSITATETVFAVVGISSLSVKDSIKVGNEFMDITNVGMGTLSTGPISGIGTFNLVEVSRGHYGSTASSHNDGVTARVYTGSYNIVGSEIWFADAPKGNSRQLLDLSDLPTGRSSFNGRVYLRNDYTHNKIYDDHSDAFTGIGATYRVQVEGANVTGIQTGSSVVLMNGIFQKPSTSNNLGNNYEFAESVGVSSIVYTGITSSNGALVINESDVNQNQVPRGGLIVSVGSTGGLGIAPLHGARVMPIMGSNKSISSIVGIGTTGTALGITSAVYNNITGDLDITTSLEHKLSTPNELVKLVGLEFTCSSSYAGLTTTIFPESVSFPLASGVGTAYPIVGVNSAFGFRCNVGTSTITHTYVGSGTAFPYFSDLDWGQGYRNIGVDSVGVGTTAVGVTVLDQAYAHKFVTAASNTIIVKANGGPGNNSTHQPSFVSYASTSGKLILTANNHGALVGTSHTATTGTTYDPTCGIMTVKLTAAPVIPIETGQLIKIADKGISFSCNFGSGGTKAYPRSSDPLSGRWIGITTTAVDTFYVNVLDPSGDRGSLIPSTNTDAHTFASAITGAITLSVNKIELSPRSLTFTCDRDNHKTKHTYPRPSDPSHGNNLNILEATDNTFTVNVGAGGGAGSGAVVTAEVVPNLHIFLTRDTNCIGISTGGSGNITPSIAAGNVPSYDPATGNITFTKSGHPLIAPGVAQTATNAAYDPSVGIVTITTQTAHGYTSGDFIQIAENSLTFKCAQDSNATNHSYPRPASKDKGADPIHNKWIQIFNASGTQFEIQCLTTGVGTASPSTNTTAHTFVSAIGGGITKANSTIIIADNSVRFSCAQDNHGSSHSYPRLTDPQRGRSIGIAATTSTTFTVNVGKSPAGTGGALKFDVKNAGSGYVNPRIVVDQPTYEGLEFKGISRLGIGSTTILGTGLLLDFAVGAARTTGIGSNMNEVRSFKIARSGYGFKIGDVLKPVGLVTSRYSNSSQLLSDFELTITDTFTDKFSSWNFGDMDQIDSILNYQDGVRTRFPLRYNEDLLSVERKEGDSDSQLIDLDTVLLIFINGVLQNPGEAYTFEGGSTILFSEAPGVEDSVSIFFYKGSTNNDSLLVTNINETLKLGDDVALLKNNGINTTVNQDTRVISGIVTTDTIETTLYVGEGINKKDWKSLSWTKQKNDIIINGEIYAKSRDSLETMVFPTARIIKDISTTDTTFYVDDASQFKYEQNRGDNDPVDFDGVLFNTPTVVATAASFTSVVSAAGTIASINITSAGSGYVGSTTSILISSPTSYTGVGVTDGFIGIGTTARATATATITNGSIASVAITNGGFGYTTANLPQTLISLPTGIRESVDDIQSVQGFTGIITGISTVSGTGSHPLAIKFEVVEESGSTFSDLSVGDAIFVHGTSVGNGVTTVDSKNADTVGIGTTFIDNIYYVHAISGRSITSNVHSGISTVGLGTTASQGLPLGRFSWGKIIGIGRSTPPISIGVTGYSIDYSFDNSINTTHDGIAGLSTFPIFQRRGTGLRTGGGFQKEIS